MDPSTVDRVTTVLLDPDPSRARLDDLLTLTYDDVECRFFAGLSVEDTSLALGVTVRTVKRDRAFARAWLFDFLHYTPTEASG